MKKLLKLSGVALMLAALVIPAMAQDKKEEARKVMLKESFKAGQRATEKSEETSDTVVKPQGQELVLQSENRVTSETKLTDILEVNAEGKPTKVRKSWTEGTETTETTQMGQPPADPVEEDSELKGVSILYTWDADKKAYTLKVEKGDAESAAVKKELTKNNPVMNPFVPGREVAIGESWDVKEQDLRDMLGKDEAMTLKEISATCKAEEIVKEEKTELLRVALEIKMTAEMKNENLGNPTVTATRTGSFYWNIKEARVERVEIESEGSFDATVQTQQGQMTITVSIDGEENMNMTYGKVEDKKDDGDDNEGGKDDDGDEDEMG